MNMKINLSFFSAFPLSLLATTPMEPWFKDVYELDRGQSLTRGQWRKETSLSYSYTQLNYNLGPLLVVGRGQNLQAHLKTNVGLLRNLDLEVDIPLVSPIQGTTSNNIKFGNVSFGLGYQFLKDNPASLQPDLRLKFTEIFPTSAVDGDYNIFISHGDTYKTDARYKSVFVFASEKLLRLGKQFTKLYLNLGLSTTNKRAIHLVSFSEDVLVAKIWTHQILWGFGFNQSIGQCWATGLSIYGDYSYHRGKAYYGSYTQKCRGVYSIAPQVEYNLSKKLGFTLGFIWARGLPDATREANTWGSYFKITYLNQ